ncbi:hypothetical protein SCHPADRAFT_943346 [Schizopora paradoxa]|uniref:Uncharacterized protein n=1 Tax=Schizopora paradoxa TaxID=27342 RepID=A0A0H2RYE9_9AGAM|nr:hypothetical protein SCHPADRAFT_943346 [Schizopora paradoxa]
MPPKSTNSSTRDLESRNSISSGGSSSSPTLAGIDEADDVDRSVPRGGLRSSISKLGGLKAAWMKAAPERFISPKQIADEIRRIRKHDKTSVYERHRNFKYEERAEPSPKFDELIPLVSRLIGFADYKAKDYERRSAAETEFFKLFAADPVIYEHFLYCQNLTQRYSPYRFGTFADRYADNTTEQEIHYRWSMLLGRNAFKMDIRKETAQTNCDALKKTFDIYGMAAMEYIPYAMGLKMQDDDLALLHQLWDNFLDYVVAQYNAFWPVSNVDLCFKNIVSSGKPLAYFASPSQLKRIAMFLIGRSSSMPFIFSTFFPPPMLESRDPEDPYGAKFTIHSPARNWDIVTASAYAIPFLDAYSKEEITNHFRPLQGKVFHSLSEFIEGEYGIGKPLERTVFAKEERAFIDLYKTVYDAAISYRRSMGVLEKLETGVQHALAALVEPSFESIVTGSLSRKDKKGSDVPRCNFFIAHTVDIDRYHKHEMFENFKDDNSYIAILNDRVRFQTFYIDPEGICSLTYIPQFRNAPYLRRFKIGSRYFITADGLPESDPQIVNIWDRILSLQDVTIDKMPLDGQILTCLRVDQESPAFDCTGHYPILAGVDFETGEELYIAAVRREVDSVWYFSTIKDGASSVTYTDEIGKEHIARSFFVLALRHDPIDLPLQDVRRRTGAKDPTGPVYWVEIWPREDTQYSSGARLREDRLLESLLSDLYEWKIKKSIIDGLD